LPSFFLLESPLQLFGILATTSSSAALPLLLRTQPPPPLSPASDLSLTYSGAPSPLFSQTNPTTMSKDNMQYTNISNSSLMKGAFPVSQLSVHHPLLPLNITLRAFSEFEMHTPNRSIAPIVFFAFDIENPSFEDYFDAAVFFNLPDIIGGDVSIFESGSVRGITLNKPHASYPGAALTQGASSRTNQNMARILNVQRAEQP
jgi:hypothetical protein